jgi:amino acid adenylation domain-containing protein
VSASALWWQVVERVAAERPDHPAVVAAGCCYSYRQLNRMANRLAWRLIDAGVRAELPVPVVAGRDIDLVLGWLAVAKAGGAFVPIDPALPGPRIDTIQSDVDAPVAVVGRSWTGRRLAPTQLPTQPADEVEADELADANPPARSGPGNLAYACYTSGSNGRPHGCLIEHGQLAGVIRWYQDAMGMSADEQVLQGAGPSFDTTIMEVFATLCGGATLHLADEAVRDPVRLPGWLAERGITSAFLPTPIAEVLIGDGSWPAGLRLHRLSTGGDQLRLRPPAGTPFELLNMYGPTECTIVATAGPIGTTPLDRLPDIGGPISDTTVYLLDGAGRPVPPGELGEIYLGGAVVGRGYHRLPGLTAARFVADPFGGPGARMYQTGDLGRLCPNGTVEFHGRADNQLEIRGYRVEPAEVERVLGAHPAVGAALAVGVPGPGGGTRLVAHVTATGPGPDERELIDWVAARLPSHMVPARVLTRPSLPRTVNGKLDRKRARQLPIPPPAPAAAPPPVPAAPRLVPAAVPPAVPPPVLAAGAAPVPAAVPRAVLPAGPPASPVADPPPAPAGCPGPAPAGCPGAAPAAGLAGASSVLAESEVDGGGPERVLAGLCADLLGLGEVDPAANFFDLGGDSLLGIRLAARAARAGVHFGPRDLLLAPSLRDLAKPAPVPAPPVPAPPVPAQLVPAPPVPAQYLPALSVAAPPVPVEPVPARSGPATDAPTGRSSVESTPPGQAAVAPALAEPASGAPRSAVPAPGGMAGPVPAAGPSRPGSGAVRRCIPLTPIMYDFLDGPGSSLRDFVDVHVLAVPPAVDAASVRAAVARLVELHEPLRYRFRHNELGWYIRPDQGPVDIEQIVDTRPLPPLVPAGEAAVVERDAAALAGQLDLRHGPALRVRHYRRRAGQGGLLLLVVHHFVADSVASVVLLDDLDVLLADHAAGRPAPARPRRPAWREWSEQLREMSRSDELAAEISYWTAILGAGTNRRRAGATGAGEFVQREIQVPPGGTGTEAALAALAAGVARWQGTPDAWVMLEGAGTPNPYRPGGRPAEVGWFTSLHPALLPAGPGRPTAAGPAAALLPAGPGRPTAASPAAALQPADPGRSIAVGPATAAGLHPALLPADPGRPTAAGPHRALPPDDPGRLVRDSQAAVAAELRSIPNDGVGYGLLRHLAPPSPALAELRSLAEPEVFIAHQANDGSTADRGARLLRVRRDLYPPPRSTAGRFPLTLVSVARPGSLLVSVQAGPGFAAAEVNALADAVVDAADPATRRS